MATKPAPLATFAKPVKAAIGADRPAAETPSPDKMRQKVFRVNAAQDRKLKEFCAHSDMTIQDVVIEGINLVLKSRGLPSI